jgi:hypothetical protein
MPHAGCVFRFAVFAACAPGRAALTAACALLSLASLLAAGGARG